MECLYCFLGCLLLAARLPLDAAIKFHDVLSNERISGYLREHNQLTGWSSDENDWNEELYPVWKKGDSRWKNSWKGGHVRAILTSDSPALVGSTITFVVDLVFPRCQREDVSGNIVYEKNCGNGTGPSPDLCCFNLDRVTFLVTIRRVYGRSRGGRTSTAARSHVQQALQTAGASGSQICNGLGAGEEKRASAGDNPLELRKTSGITCLINRYGYFKATITIVEGILEVNIIQMTDVLMPVPQPDNSLMDFVVTCQGMMPTEVCTVVSDPTCQITYDTVCDPVGEDMGHECLLTVRRAFSGSGTYCMNLTLGDNTSLALTSTLVSIPARDPASPSRMANGVLVAVGCLAIFVTVITLWVYKKHKEYNLIENSTGIVVKGKGLNVFLNRAKAMFYPGIQEKDPLLKHQPGTP
ncbi:transmembrane glycoprotein NMB isoform X1 [Canis lupus familiaris]|uniref:transmembrane glycoprotein NMB isoform X1 n=1 Tax=Canis lupus familiaris TaxID=9615 RepID=UPI0018F3A9F2|nr:transmembrane glycoprotein NMB isoform X1 [Canis lupus familiaris]